MVNAWAQSMRFTIVEVPISGDAKVAAVPKTFGDQSFPDVNIDFDKPRDISDQHETAPTTKQVKAFVGWFQGGVDSTLKESTDHIQRRINSTTVDNIGLVNALKTKLRREDDMLYQFLRACINPEDFVQFSLEKKHYTFFDEADRKKSYSGLVLLALMLEVMKPIVDVSVKHLETDLEALKLADFQYNFKKYTAAVQDLLRKILAVDGKAYNARTITIAVFAQCELMDNPEWLAEVYSIKRRWHENDIKFDAIVAKLGALYTTLAAGGEWDKSSKKSEQIIALTTQVHKLQSDLKKTVSSMKSGDRIPKKQSGTKKPDAAASSNATQPKRAGAPEWQITKKGDKIKHPDTNVDMIWCPHHKSQDGVVNGMYMAHPHNHEQWQIDKTKRIADRKAFRAKRKNDGDHVDDKTSKKTGSINNGASKLRPFLSLS